MSHKTIRLPSGKSQASVLLMVAVLAIAFALSAAMPSPAFAEQQIQDGMKLTIDTEKAEYNAGDTIKGRAVVENTNAFPVQDVTLSVDLPAEMSFTVNPPEATAATLGAGETLAIDFEAKLAPTNPPDEEKPTEDPKENPPAPEDDTPEPQSAADAPRVAPAALPQTGDGFPAALVLLGVGVAAAAVGLIAYRRKVKPTDMMALVLVAALAAPVAAGSLPGIGEAYADSSSLQATHGIKALGDDKELKAAAVYTIPAPAPTTQAVSFLKTDASTGLPLGGAQFELSDTAAGNDLLASSDADGQVVFALVPIGTYALTEVQAPSGYLDYTMTHTVEVTAGGVTIDGGPMASFSVANVPIPAPPLEKTPNPTIDVIVAGAAMITGHGEPGATVTVYLPLGAEAQVVVGLNGTWLVFVPASETPLQASDEVKASQIQTGKTESDVVTQTVIPSV